MASPLAIYSYLHFITKSVICIVAISQNFQGIFCADFGRGRRQGNAVFQKPGGSIFSNRKHIRYVSPIEVVCIAVSLTPNSAGEASAPCDCLVYDSGLP